jgi:hypothetical protein
VPCILQRLDNSSFEVFVFWEKAFWNWLLRMFWSHQLQTNLAHMYFMQADGTHHYQPYNETCWHTQYLLSARAWNLERPIMWNPINWICWWHHTKHRRR